MKIEGNAFAGTAGSSFEWGKFFGTLLTIGGFVAVVSMMASGETETTGAIDSEATDTSEGAKNNDLDKVCMYCGETFEDFTARVWHQRTCSEKV